MMDDGLLMYTLMTEPMCVNCGKVFGNGLNDEGNLLVLSCECKRQRVFLMSQWCLIEDVGDVLDQTILLNLVGLLGDVAKRNGMSEKDEVKRIREAIFGNIDITEVDRDVLVKKLREWQQQNI